MTERSCAIRCEGLGKRYAIGGEHGYETLREAVAHAATSPFRALKRWRNKLPGPARFVWSLRDIDLEIGEGDIVGVIGRNGAGKSTLLRILAGITEPTEGRAMTYGRVGSLLEVGAGFHPELTGRENILLGGMLLGMRRPEVRAQFEEIVAFAEIEQFLDTPVKRYSSGMYMRLAFSVAAHLQTEILLVDEALAVGDLAFQRKCLEKMGAVAGEGRTVLFVSHDTTAIQRLCRSAILLDRGRLVRSGITADVLLDYVRSTRDRMAMPGEWLELHDHAHSGSGRARFSAVRCSGATGSPAPRTGEPFIIEIEIESDEDLSIGCIEALIRDPRGIPLMSTDTALLGHVAGLRRGKTIVRVSIDQLPLNPGAYQLGLWMAQRNYDTTPVDWVEAATDLDVLTPGPEQFDKSRPEHGPVACRFSVSEQHIGP